jgi:hypothetical protein
VPSVCPFGLSLGKRYAGAEQAERQEIFGRQVLANVPLAERICASLADSETGACQKSLSSNCWRKA